MRTIDPDERDLASPEEAAGTLATMSNADLIRLQHFARFRTAGLPWLDWEDLLHEAIDRVLSGSRKWPKSVPFIAFMCGTMRSIASEFWRLRSTKGEMSYAELGFHSDRSRIEEVPDDSPNPEREAAARQLLSEIESLFEGDVAALAVLNGLANGSAPSEIQRLNGMNPKSYATAQKRVRRKINRFMRETQQ